MQKMKCQFVYSHVRHTLNFIDATQFIKLAAKGHRMVFYGFRRVHLSCSVRLISWWPHASSIKRKYFRSDIPRVNLHYSLQFCFHFSNEIQTEIFRLARSKTLNELKLMFSHSRCNNLKIYCWRCLHSACVSCMLAMNIVPVRSLERKEKKKINDIRSPRLPKMHAFMRVLFE